MIFLNCSDVGFELSAFESFDVLTTILPIVLNVLTYWMLTNHNETNITMIWKNIKWCKNSTFADLSWMTSRIENQSFAMKWTIWDWMNPCSVFITWDKRHGKKQLEPGSYQGKCKKLYWFQSFTDSRTT